jgi:ankyrin repeat protein
MVAAKEGNLAAVRILMHHKAIIDLVDDENKSAVYYAAMNNNEDVLRMLLNTVDGKLLMDESDKDGKIPIHIAAEKGQLEAATILVESGSSVDRKDFNSRRPMHLAAANGWCGIIELIIQYDRNSIMCEDVNGNTPLHAACGNDEAKAAERLLKYGASTDNRNSSFHTPLLVATMKNSINSARSLLEVKALSNEMARRGRVIRPKIGGS